MSPLTSPKRHLGKSGLLHCPCSAFGSWGRGTQEWTPFRTHQGIKVWETKVGPKKNVMFVGYQTQSNYSYCSYNYHKPKREIVVIWPNLAIERGPHFVGNQAPLRAHRRSKIQWDQHPRPPHRLVEGSLTLQFNTMESLKGGQSQKTQQPRWFQQ